MTDEDFINYLSTTEQEVVLSPLLVVGELEPAVAEMLLNVFALKRVNEDSKLLSFEVETQRPGTQHFDAITLLASALVVAKRAPAVSAILTLQNKLEPLIKNLPNDGKLVEKQHLLHVLGKNRGILVGKQIRASLYYSGIPILNSDTSKLTDRELSECMLYFKKTIKSKAAA